MSNSTRVRGSIVWTRCPTRAQAAGLNAHDRIGPRVERRFFAEHLYADDVLLQIAAAAAHRFDDDEVDEPFQSINLRERLAGEKAIQLLTHSPFRYLAGSRRAAFGGHQARLCLNAMQTMVDEAAGQRR